MAKDKDKVTEEALRRQEADAAAGAMVAEEQLEGALERRPRAWLTIALRYLLPLALTVALVWYMFRMVDFSGMMEILREGADYWWILLAMGISVLSHVFRAAKWRLQLRFLGINAPFMALCCSIFGCYALNLVFPRLGEVWRCSYIAKREKAPFTTVLGSMVSDRLTDSLSVLLITLITFIVAAPALGSFLDKYPVGRDFLSLLANPFFWIALGVGAAIVVSLLYFGRKTAAVVKLRQWTGELWQGFSTLWQMKGVWLFALYTLAVWGCYYLQFYVAFFAFDFTTALCHAHGTAFGLIPALVAFLFSAIGMAVPSNGGLGPWNLAVMFGLAIYGITETQGSAFSMALWTGQTVMLILLGIYTMIYIAFSKSESVGPKPYKNPSEP